jgi:hypothetical protein
LLFLSGWSFHPPKEHPEKVTASIKAPTKVRVSFVALSLFMLCLRQIYWLKINLLPKTEYHGGTGVFAWWIDNSFSRPGIIPLRPKPKAIKLIEGIGFAVGDAEAAALDESPEIK